MKGDPKVLEVLSEALSEELTAINQYFLHAEMCESWGFSKLSAEIRKQSIDEMKHAEVLIERILFLEGTPNMTKYRKMNIGKDVPGMIKNDLALEISAVKMYNDALATAAKAGDNGSAELLKKLLLDEEMHVDWLEEQTEKLKAVGTQNYLALQMGGE
jgi:bacterioferritin